MVNEVDSKAHILIVDDEPEIRNMVRGMLCESYKCTAIGSAEEALLLLRAIAER